jgi:nucleoside-diphosphate-sugar epimerase
MPSRTVLITGATGTIGRELVTALLEAGHSVVGAALDAKSPVQAAGFTYESVDIADSTAMTQVLERHSPDTLIHLAALVHVRDPKLGFSDYSRLNYRASEHLFNTAKSLGVQRIVFTSTIEVYGQTPKDALVDENFHCYPESDYARTKLLAEESLQTAAQGSPLSYAILRLAPVYSASFRLNLDKRLYLKAPKIGYYVGNGRYQLSFCSVKNIAFFVTEWLNHEPPQSGTFNLADAQTYPIEQLLQLERREGRCPVTLRVPYWPSLAALSMLDAGLDLLGRQTSMLTASNIRKLVRSPRWITHRATSVVGELPWNIENALASLA